MREVNGLDAVIRLETRNAELESIIHNMKTEHDSEKQALEDAISDLREDLKESPSADSLSTSKANLLKLSETNL